MPRIFSETTVLAVGVAATLALGAYDGFRGPSRLAGAVLAGYSLFRLWRSFYSAHDPMSSDAFYRTPLGPVDTTSAGGHRIREAPGEPAVSRPAPSALSAPGWAAPALKPARPAGPLPARWVAPEETVEVAGHTLKGGLFYFGSVLKDAQREADPSLIDPRKPVQARALPAGSRIPDYWPSYSHLAPDARAAYLQWMASGRTLPDIDPAFLSLFFYGVERHVLLDGVKIKGSRQHWPAITSELVRLRAQYGKVLSSLTHQMGELLQYMQLLEVPPTLYEQPLPLLQAASPDELPVYLRLALGQLARDKRRVPAHLAFAWQQHHPHITHRTAIRRCPEQFEQLWPDLYQEVFADGFKLTQAANPLTLLYRPVSTAFERGEQYELALQVPDVALRHEYLLKLQVVVDACDDALKPFSRALARTPDSALSLDALLRLPARLWPDTAQEVLEDLQDATRAGMVVESVAEVLTRFSSTQTGLTPELPTRDGAAGLTSVLAQYEVGIQPSLESVTRLEDCVVLYAAADKVALPVYESAVLDLLAALLRPAQGSAVTPALLSRVDSLCDQWTALAPPVRTALKAYWRAALYHPATPAALKKRLAPLSAEQRAAAAPALCRGMSLAGHPGPDEIRALEKSYKLLGQAPGLVYGHLHEAATGSVAPAAGNAEAPFVLDTQRIARLQADTHEVAGLLSTIFVEDTPAPTPLERAAAPLTPVPLTAPPTPLLPGLDAAHDALARALHTQGAFTRQAWEQACAAASLMPDGALERVNEASFDAHNMPLTEGDDPITLNPDVLEMLS